jgi:hypothetical protein
MAKRHEPIGNGERDVVFRNYGRKLTEGEISLLDRLVEFFPEPVRRSDAAHELASLVDQGLTRPGSWEADVLCHTRLPAIHAGQEDL